MSDEKKKRGRPLKDGARRKRIHALVSDEEFERLHNVSLKVGKPMSEIIRNGINIAVKGESDLYDLQHDLDDLDDFDGEYDD